MKKADEQLMVQYLLGELPEAEQLRLEEQYFTDDEAYQQLLALEDELRYDYAQGALAPLQRERFEKRFLTSPAERQRVEFAGTILHKVMNARVRAVRESELATEESKPWWSSLLAFFNFQHPALQFSLAAAGLVALLGGAWLIYETLQLRTQLDRLQAERMKERETAQQQVAAQQARQDQLSSELERERQQRAELAQELARQQASASRESAQSPSPRSSILAFVLSPGLLRGADEPKRLLIPPGVDSLRLQLEVRKKSEYLSYRAVLKTLDGNELWSQDVRRVQTNETSRAIVLHLPGKLLPEGDYVITLLGVTAGGAFAEVDNYYFSVVKK